MSETDRGLDLSKTGSITSQEKTEFQQFYASRLGRSHPGLDFWLDRSPDVLKRYRSFATANVPDPLKNTEFKGFPGFAFLEYYGLLGYLPGIQYIVRLWQEQGLSKDQVLEGLSIGFLHLGPRGMATVAEALEGYPWIDQEKPAEFASNWSVDPDAFTSGLDFSTRELTPDELELLLSWYERTLGEVPRYVTYLGKYSPDALKAYRGRYESCIRTLPKQVMPYTLLHYSVIRGSGDGIRENVLLARAFGMTREQALRAVYSALLNAAVETVSLVDRVAGPVFADWSSAS
jgi:hypothetical protein